MCGIAGFMWTGPQRFEARPVLQRMGDSIRHRGPDASGLYVRDAVALCHQRLSIIDLSEAGAQPMTSQSGRYVIVFNGEIYNFQSLRAELEADGTSFRGHSDTEVLLALYEKLGEACLARLNGMFALAIWDTVAKTLFLARDRLGKKPLYFYRNEHLFAFASEIKALRCIPGIDLAIRHDAIKDYFFHQYVPDPKSVFRHIHKLPPAHWLKAEGHDIEERAWWDVSFQTVAPSDDGALADELHDLLEDSVRLRMISDVPLGAFLSGGIDSSAMVGYMARHAAAPVTTCSIGFDSREHDEVDQARSLAMHFGTDHHEFTVASDIEQSVLQLAPHFDEPFADSSFVPTYHVSRLARQRVTVALSGDGGDENFAGYQKYLTDQLECRLRSLVPSLLRKRVCPALSLLLAMVPMVSARRGASLCNTLSVGPDEGFFKSNSFFDRRLWDSMVVGELAQHTRDHDPGALTRDLYNRADTDDHLGKLLYTDIKSYLPGDILVKVDRMSMANSLETRAPLLDYRIVELAASMPSHLKLQGRTTKAILRDSLRRLLPEEVFNRPKAGFSVPLAGWLRRDLRALAESRLFAPGSGVSEYFDPARLRQLWDAHQSGQRDYSAELWSFLVFELWWQHAVVGGEVATNPPAAVSAQAFGLRRAS